MLSPIGANTEFKITIGADKMSATYGSPERLDRETVSVEPWAVDELSLKTALLFESWLNLWNQIEGIKGAALFLKHETFKVIGAHLWNLIFFDSNGTSNKVGAKLREQIRSTGRNDPLHVLIHFTPDANYRLKMLPWEFLCDPETNEFLATLDNIVLTRYVDRRDGLISIEAGESKLGVLFVNLLPGKIAQDTVNEIEELCKQLNKSDSPVEVIDIVRGLQESERDGEEKKITGLAKALRSSEKRCDVVHVFGLCKGEPGTPKIYLPEEDDYADPEPLIVALTARDASDDWRPPSLVILHLAEWDAGDAEDNFERLAPLLIEKGVPAVLAMQYPVPTGANMDDLVEFYNALANGDLLGVAVQASRRRAANKKKRRQLAAPVLYLQQDGKLIKRPLPPRGQQAVYEPKLGYVQPPIIASVLRQAMKDELSRGLYDSEHEKTYLKWIKESDFSDDIETVLTQLRRFARNQEIDDAHRRINQGLTEVLMQLGKGVDDVRGQQAERSEASSRRRFVKDRRP
jgi:hypothetical protein